MESVRNQKQRGLYLPKAEIQSPFFVCGRKNIAMNQADSFFGGEDAQYRYISCSLLVAFLSTKALRCSAEGILIRKGTK